MLPTFEVHDSNQRLAVAVPREIVGEYINDMGEVVRGLAGKPAAVVLANHGSVVVGKDGEVGCNAIGELEDTSRLALLMRDYDAWMLTDEQIKDIVTTFDVEWDD